MRHLFRAWIAAHRKVWGGSVKPKVGLLVTNSESKKSKFGTPVIGQIATNGRLHLRLEEETQEFVFDFDHQTVSVKRFAKEALVLPPLTDEQCRHFGVQFGGQYSS